MVLFNYSTKELTAKIVYYGPGLCGKTTNLQYIHSTLPENVKGKMLSLATKTDRTLFFDFLPIDLGDIRGMKTRVQLYTVPGQVFYNETRKLVLKGADGIVFVADSQKQMISANAESFKNLEENLKAHGLKLAEMPHVIQFNKRDLPKLAGIEELNAAINKYNAPFYESVATTGIGVQDSLKAITKLVLLHLTRKYESRPKAATAAPPAPTATMRMSTTPSPARPGSRRGVPLSEMPGPNPLAAKSIPVAPVAVTPSPIAATPSPVAATPSPIAATPSPVPATPSPIAATPVAAPVADPVPQFNDAEIADLVDEVEDAAAPVSPSLDAPLEQPAADPAATLIQPPAPEPVSPLSFEIDHGVDPDWSPKAQQWTDAPARGGEPDLVDEPEMFAEPTLPPPSPDPAPGTEPGPGLGEIDASDPGATAESFEEVPVTLTDPVDDRELFEDPSLEVARMSGNDEREIVVPVELGDASTGTMRYKLSIRLRLDPVD